MRDVVHLTPREQLVLRLMWEGMRSSEISMALDLSRSRVEQIRLQLGRKLHATTGILVIRRAIEQGLIQV